MKKLIAFTLAEVIIVMGIIGVVAEMTIPGLVNETQKAQGLSGLKKVYTEMNQTLNTMAQDVGCTGDITCIFDSNDTDTMGAKFASYFKTVKTCATNVTGCFPNVIAYNYDGTNRASGYASESSTYRFITKDGMAFKMRYFYTNCSGNFTQGLPSVCLYDLWVDVNGLAAPNTMGRDVFKFFIDKKKGCIPNGAPGIPSNPKDLYYWNRTSDTPGCQSSNKYGGFCGGRIMDEGWQMKY